MLKEDEHVVNYTTLNLNSGRKFEVDNETVVIGTLRMLPDCDFIVTGGNATVDRCSGTHDNRIDISNGSVSFNIVSFSLVTVSIVFFISSIFFSNSS